MKSNAKSSITLPPEELRLVVGLMKHLGAKTKVEVVRRGLHLLKDSVDREALKESYARAAKQVRASTIEELRELDGLSSEGLDED